MWMLFLVTVVFALLTSLFSPTQKAKAGTFDDFDFPQIEDGSPVFYIAGRVRMNGPNLIWYGDFTSQKIKKRTGLFKKSVVGHKYFLGWQLGLCIGADVKLRKIWFGSDDPSWTGNTGELIGGNMKDLEAFGGADSGGGYDITFDFYEGNTTQDFNAYLVNKVVGDPVSAFRGLCYIVMRGYIGNATQLQNVSVELDRVPDPLALGARALIGTEGDVNPANVLYELLSNNFGALGVNPSKVNVASFIAGGIRFYDEDEGISISAGGNPTAISNMFQDILKQVDATMYEDPLDGQIYLKLIRDDYVIDDLPVLDQSNITQMSSYAINLWADTKNKVRVSYQDRTKNYEDRVAVAEDMANVAFQGSQSKPVNSDHKYVKRSAHANRIATRELAIYSTPLANIRAASFRFDLNLRPGTPVLLNYPEYQISNLVARVTKVDLGDLENNRLLLELTGDKFARSLAIYGAPSTSGWVQPSFKAANIVNAIVQESPRWFNVVQDGVQNPDAARIMALPAAANAAQLGFSLYARTTTETAYEQIISGGAFVAKGVTQTAYPQSYAFDTATGIELASIDAAEVLVAATTALIRSRGDNLIQINGEIMAFETVDLTGPLPKLKGIRRGLLDTTPVLHPIGSRVYWIEAENVGLREFASTATATTVLASNAVSGAQDDTTGVPVPVPGALP